ncbi:MAG: hypothetical protein ACREPM_10280 [Gemmatimonadaceae bacterium]
MIQVTIGCHDSGELALVQALLEQLEARRRAWIDKRIAEQSAAQDAEAPASRPRRRRAAAPSAEGPPAPPAEESKVIDLMGALKESLAATKADVAVEPTEQETVDALRAAITRGVPMPHVVGFLTEKQVKRVTELASGDRAAFIAHLTGWTPDTTK